MVGVYEYETFDISKLKDLIDELQKINCASDRVRIQTLCIHGGDLKSVLVPFKVTKLKVKGSTDFSLIKFASDELWPSIVIYDSADLYEEAHGHFLSSKHVILNI